MMDEKVIKIINEAYPKMTDKEKLAFGIAFGAHTGNGQKDYAGLEYIGHPLTVYLNCDTEEERIVALLHDVVEDTDITCDELAMFFSSEVVEAIRVISHPKVYDKEKYMNDIKANKIARKVKIEDLRTNMDRSRLESLLEWHDNRVKNQYSKNLEFLLKD